MTKKRAITVVVLILVFISGLYLYRKPVVNIAYMSDSQYVPYVMVSLHSALKNKHPDTIYNVHIIAKDFPPEDKIKIKRIEQENVHINIYPAQEHKLNVSRLGRFGAFEVALQKLFIAEYLKGVKKVLYLDADTLVQEDLSDIYQTNITGRYAAAVKDGLMYQYPEHITELNLRNKELYFNSGVMLLNLEQMRKDEIIKKAVIYFNTHNDIFGDQDVLNVVFAGKVKPVSYRYNCNSVFFEEKEIDFLSAFWQENMPQTPQAVYEKAAILHFAGHKPWTDWFNQPYLKPLWWKYAKETQAKYGIAF